MLPSYLDMLAILGMASATYFTRICGYLWLRKHQLSARARAVLESSPCCVMVSVVAPSFMTTDPKTLVALLCAVGLAFKSKARGPTPDRALPTSSSHSTARYTPKPAAAHARSHKPVSGSTSRSHRLPKTSSAQANAGLLHAPWSF